ncbi:MAG: putative SapB synthase, partial [Solirubrobacteraceae bacterium]|nr:putative SapB synthase [Solirubrobacteraceae bacterium]
MDKSYELYCLADADFYDSALLPSLHDESFALARRETPAGWQSARTDDWLMYAPDELRLPSQGW